MNQSQDALLKVRNYDPIGDREKAIKQTMCTYRTKQTVNAIEYQPGTKVPGLLYESDGVKGEHGDIGPHAVVLVGSQYVVVFPGYFLAYEGNDDPAMMATRVIDPTLMTTYQKV